MKISGKICGQLSLFMFIVLFTCCASKPAALESRPKTNNPKIKFAYDLEESLKKDDYEKALALFDTVKEELKNDPQIKNLKLSILISANRIKEASEYASELEKENPGNTDIMFTLVMLAQAENNSKKKNMYLEKILAKNPKDARALSEQGMDLYSKAKYNEAHKKFTEAYKADPKCINALIGLARVNYMQNKLDQAETNLKAALDLEPDNNIALAELARIKSETDRMHEALQDIKKAVDLAPENTSHWMDLASYNMRLGKQKEARAAFTKAIELSPDSHVAYIYRAGLNDELGYKAEALNDHLKVCELYPSYYFACEGAGILFWEKGDWKNAGASFIKALAKAPQAYQYAMLTAICYAKMNEKPAAKEFMQKYIKTIDRAKRPTDYLMCRLFVDFAGDTEIHSKASAEKNLTNRGRMFFYLAIFYEIMNKPKLAETCYTEVLAIKNPSFFEYRLAVKAMGSVKPK